MRPVKPKNDDEDDCRRSWSKRSDTLVASTELSPLWLPGAQSLELSIESSYCMYVWCPCKTQACQNQNESIVREGGRQRVVALWKPMPKHIKLMSLKTPAAAVNSLKRLQESKASKSCRADRGRELRRKSSREKRPFVDVFVVFFFAMWLLAVCVSVWNVCVACAWGCVCVQFSQQAAFCLHSLLASPYLLNDSFHKAKYVVF